jgi:hypothetical protein
MGSHDCQKEAAFEKGIRLSCVNIGRHFEAFWFWF